MVNGVQAASGEQGRGAAPSIHSITPAAVTLCTLQLDALGLGTILPHHWDPQSGSAQLGPGRRTLNRETLTLPSLREPSPQLQATFPGALVTERGRLVQGPGAVAKSPAPAAPFWSQPRCKPEGCSGLPSATVIQCLETRLSSSWFSGKSSLILRGARWSASPLAGWPCPLSTKFGL